jgi:hypothetical protein
MGRGIWIQLNETVVQDFSFEDAGNGFVYIRGHLSNLYVTAQGPDSVLTDVTKSSPGARESVSNLMSVAGSKSAHPACSLHLSERRNLEIR